MKIEYYKMVMCPEQKKPIEVDNECAGCDYYENTDDFGQCVICNFKSEENDDE